MKNFLFNTLPGRSNKNTLVSMTQAWLLFHRDKKNSDAKQKMINLLRQREDLIHENQKLRHEAADLSAREEWLRNKINEDWAKWSNLSKELLEIAVSILNRARNLDKGAYHEKWFNDNSMQLQRYN